MIPQMVPHVMVAGVHWPVPHRAPLMRALRARLSAAGLEPVRARETPLPFGQEEELADRLHCFRGLVLVALDPRPDCLPHPTAPPVARGEDPRAWVRGRLLCEVARQLPVLVLGRPEIWPSDGALRPRPGVTICRLGPDAGPEALESPDLAGTMAGWIAELRETTADEPRWYDREAAIAEARRGLSWQDEHELDIHRSRLLKGLGILPRGSTILGRHLRRRREGSCWLGDARAQP